MRAVKILVSCEHASARVPRAFEPWFEGAGAILSSHRGYDPGALAMARALARRLCAPLFAGSATRLLVDLNRSLHHPRLLSEYSRGLDAGERATLIAQHYLPYRLAVESAVSNERHVLHLSAHSFTPALGGRERNADFGLLYDPSRRRERAFCIALQRELGERLPWLRVRRNYPYRGVGDGLTTHLRRRRSDARYLGIELELNQRFAGDARAPQIHRALGEGVTAALLSIGDRPA